MMLYGLVKFDQLLNKRNPTVTTFEERQEFEEEINLVNLSDDADLRFAFSIMDHKSEETLLDPRYVKVIARVFTKFANGTETELVVGHHPCTDDDWAQFAPPQETDEELLDKIQNSNKHTFLCLDWERDGNELSIGRDSKGSTQTVEFMLTPCNYVHKYLGYEGDTIKDECIADEQAQRKYLGSYRVYTYAT